MHKQVLSSALIVVTLCGCGPMPPAPPMDAADVTGQNWNCPHCYKESLVSIAEPSSLSLWSLTLRRDCTP